MTGIRRFLVYSILAAAVLAYVTAEPKADINDADGAAEAPAAPIKNPQPVRAEAAESIDERRSGGDKNRDVLLRRTMSNKLYFSTECANYIMKYCPRADKIELSDLTVLQCIYNEVPDLSVIDKECQHLLYSHKKNLTINLKVDSSAIQICKDEIEKMPECKSANQAQGQLVACLLDNRDNITNVACRSFLTNVAALIFTDYHLVYNFHTDCSLDIETYKCGRLQKSNANGDHDDEEPTQQGQTLECLSKQFAKLQPACRKQMVRITELQGEDFHLDRPLYFACREDRERLCERIPSGEGRVYKCLMKNKFNSEMSSQCREQLTRRQGVIVEDAQADHSLITKCKTTILKSQCRSELRTHHEEGIKLASLLICLETVARDNDADVDPECQEELIEHRKMLMSDYKLNPYLVKACAEEIKTHCNGGLQRGGKTLHCLLSKAKSTKKSNDIPFGVQCIAELRNLVKTADVAEDVRVDPHLQYACQSLLSSSCRDVQPGKGRVISCLMKFLNTPQMTDECEERLLEIQFFVSRDWKLTPKLYESCREDAAKFCNAGEKWSESGTTVDGAPLVLPCLFHHIHEDEDGDKEVIEKLSAKCTAEVKSIMYVRAQNIELLPNVQEKCAEDLAEHCSKRKMNQKGEEMRCLQRHYSKLKPECHEVIKEFSEAESKDVRLDHILMNACMPMIEEYCGERRDEKGGLLECLIMQKNNAKIDPKCKTGIEHHQLLNMEDVAFNFKFKKACDGEIREHCARISKNSLIVQCLSEMVLNDTLLDKQQRVGSKCRDQLRFEFLQMNEDIKLDDNLLKKCEQDVQEYCKDVESGKGQILECLKTQNKKLSPDCYKSLFKRDKINLVDQSVDYVLQSRCRNAIKMFCTVDGEGDILGCLRKHLTKPDLEPACRSIVINRIMVQNTDVRLNANLWKQCTRDVNKQCADEVANTQDANSDLHGRVIKCLKRAFVANRLSKQCEGEVEEVMREAASVDYRLDPLLVEGCLAQIEKLCSDEPNDKKEDCLRLAFQNNKIDDQRCFEEIKRIIIEGAADVFVDRELSHVCMTDLMRFCSEVPPGSSQQLKCLLGHKSAKVKLSGACDEMLSSRQQLWNQADVDDSLSGLNDLVHIIHKSESRNYLYAVLFFLITAIFVFGCLCRPALIRARQDKRK